MYFLNYLSPVRRHQFISITGASIISYLYYHIFFRNISTQALSPLKYSRIIGIFDSTSKYTPASKSLLNQHNYFYITRLSLNSSPDYCKNLNSKYSTHESTYDTAFKHSILDMGKSAVEDEPQWVKESMNYNHESFDNLGSVYIPELGMVATNYKHKLSGFNVMSLKTHIDSGKEMCFDLCVPTPPLNSKGSPHVLEHSVLAGTPKYPSKDAFSILTQGGFTSFLNATTYKDRTSYLFASTNEKGFYQVADVYMDSFFRPNISHDKLIFDQECWHYRVTDGSADKSDADIVLHDRTIGFAGIVYSEMKLRSADPSVLFYYLTFENLFNNSYKYISGGAPKDIVDLSHQELINFYHLYYGPRTSMLYLYGPYDLKNRLDFVHKYLTSNNIGINTDPTTGKLTHDANLCSSDSNLNLEEYKSTPKYDSAQFSSANPNEDEFMISWLLDPTHNGSADKYKIDFVDNIGFQVLQYLLMGTPESVLYKALIDSNLGKKVIGTGFSAEYRQAIFSVGLKGVDKQKHGSKEEMTKRFEKIVFDTLNSIKEKGFKLDAIESGLNSVEFEMRELNSGYYPKGLMLICLMQTQFQYGKDPFGLLRFDSLMAELKKRIYKDEPSKYFVDLMVKHLLNNTTRVTLHLEAVESKEFEKTMNKKIAEKLQSRLSHLSREEVDRMEQNYINFKEDRQKPEGPEVLNNFETLELSDVCREQEKIPTKSYKLHHDSLSNHSNAPNSTNEGVTVHTHPLESHGILYMDYALSLDGFTVDDLKYLGIFASMLRESGTDRLSPEEVSYLIDKNLGGLSFSTYFSTVSNNQTYDYPNKGVGYLVVRSKSLKHKTDKMVDVVHDLLSNANFSNSKKGLELLKRSLSIFQSNVANEGHEFASLRLSSRFSVSNFAEELVSGYSQLVFLKDELIPLAEKDWSKVESRLNDMRTKLLNLRNVTVNLTGDQELVENFLKQPSAFYNKLSSTFKYNSNNNEHTNIWVSEVLKNKLMESSNQNELIVAPTNVNYVGMGGKLFDTHDPILGSDSLVFHYLRRTHLFKLVRMTLGAYGVFANILNTGHLLFVSYADPNFQKTLDVYNNIPASLKEAYDSLNDRDLLRQKIGKLSHLDKPLHVESKALLSLKRLLRNESDEFRQSIRDDIFDTTKECFKRLADRFENEKDWKHICSVVNNTTSNEVSKEFKRLYIN